MPVGVLDRVSVTILATALTADASLGATTLTVDWTGEFGASGVLDIGGVEHAYTTVDDTILQLATALTANVATGEAVLALDANGAERTLVEAYVRLDDGEEPLPYRVHTGLEGRITEATPSGTPVIVDLTKDQVVGLDGVAAPLAFESVVTVPATDGVAPPPVTTLVADGGIRSVFLSWVPVANPDPVRYLVYGGTQPGFPLDDNHLITQTAGARAIVYGVWDDAAAVLLSTLVPGIPYYFRVVSLDDDVDGVEIVATPSAEVEGTPAQVTGPDIANESVTTAKLLANAVTADKLDAVLALLSRIELGAYFALEAGQGLKTEPPNGRGVHIPDDGVSPNIFQGESTLDRLIVTDAMDVQGSVNKISGLLNLADGIVAPTAAPVMSTSWSHAAAYNDTEIDEGLGTYWDLQDYSATEFIYLETFLDSFSVWALNKTTGARGLLAGPTTKMVAVSVCATATEIYVLGKVLSTGPLDPERYQICRYSRSTGAFIGQAWVMAATGGTYYKGYDPMITRIGSDIGLVYIDRADNKVYARKYTTGLALVAGGEAVSNITWPGGARNLTGIYWGTADYGSNEYLCLTDGGLVRAFSSNWTARTLTSHHQWINPNSEVMQGLAWDGTRFHTVGKSTYRVYHFARQFDVAASSWAYSLYDSNATGGTHETQAGKTVSFSTVRRHWIRAATPAPITLGTGPDDPDKVRFYVAGKRQVEVPVGSAPSVAILDIIDTAGATAPTSNGFAALPGQNGQIQIGKSDSNGPLIRLEGNGAWRLGHLSGNPDGTNADDTGWLDIVFESGYQNLSSSAPCQVRRVGNEVQVRGLLTKSSGTFTAGVSVKVGSTPAAATPSRNVFLAHATDAATGLAKVQWQGPSPNNGIFVVPIVTASWISLYHSYTIS